MIVPKNVLRIATVCSALLFIPACWSQVATAPEFDTASEGVRAADVEAAVGLICLPRDITRTKEGSVSGCRVCPKGTDFRGSGHSDWGLYAKTSGHFTSPQDDNLLLDGTGCDSHASNFGGSFMFTLRSGKPRLLKYDQGLVTSRCRKFSFPDGRNFLVCQGGWTGQGENIGTVFMAAFDITGKDLTTKLITTTDTTYTCGDDPTQVVQESDVQDIKFSTKDSGEITGMTVSATLGDVKCAQVKNDKKKGQLSGTVKAYEIGFLFDGKDFKTAPTSSSTLERFESK
jgi:hypothetical protein